MTAAPGPASPTFRVRATGNGTLTYQWQTNSVNISNSSHYGGCTKATLTATNVTGADTVNYRCVVTGGCGSATSSNATVTCAATAPTLSFASVEMLPENRVRLVVTGTPGDSVTIYQSTDLVNWLPLTNLVNTTGTLQVTDPSAGTAAQRFCRATTP